ncbi:MAG TPA: hypothetical protein VFN61_07725, partial [Acidimicrobiales bacterium]|nr:hypothetical protein [Acidimicrobiales bacterium]
MTSQNDGHKRATVTSGVGLGVAGDEAPGAPGCLRRAQIVGTGLIGGSIGMSLRQLGWWVTGEDADKARAARAMEVGAVDAVGRDIAAEITVVAVPAGAVAAVATEVLRRQDESPGPPVLRVVTDVAGVKDG